MLRLGPSSSHLPAESKYEAMETEKTSTPVDGSCPFCGVTCRRRCGGDNREMTQLPLDASFIRLVKVKRRVMTQIYSIIISSVEREERGVEDFH